MNRVVHLERVMGTVVSVELANPDGDPQPALAAVARWLHDVEATFSPFIADSVISRIGRGEIDSSHPSVPKDVIDVLADCERLRADSGGVFDIANVPMPNGTRFNPCGYVKGWAVQRAGEMLLAAGHPDWCINAGGDVLVSGTNQGGEPWRIGVRHPDLVEMLAVVVEHAGPFAVATSASYERGAHIVDGRDGEPVTELASVTVVGPDLTRADAYATTVYAMGLDGLTWLAAREGFEVCAITRDEEIVATPGFAAYEAQALPGCPTGWSSGRGVPGSARRRW